MKKRHKLVFIPNGGVYKTDGKTVTTIQEPYNEVRPVTKSWWKKLLRLPAHKHDGVCLHTKYHLGIDWAIDAPKQTPPPKK